MRILILLLLVSCATTQLTEREKEEQEYFETERRELYQIWRKSCLDADGVVFLNSPTRPCRMRSNCIPHAFDWSHKRKLNRVQCISRDALRDIFRGV